MIGLLLKLIPGFGTVVRLSQFAVGVVYPTLKSFEAIESPGSKDDEQWLTYWVVYSFVNIVEHLLWVVLMWVPLYGLLKTLLLLWLVAPQFYGAKALYIMFIRPALRIVADKLVDIPALEEYVKPFLAKTLEEIQKKKDVSVPDEPDVAEPVVAASEETKPAAAEESKPAAEQTMPAAGPMGAAMTQ